MAPVGDVTLVIAQACRLRVGELDAAGGHPDGVGFFLNLLGLSFLIRGMGRMTTPHGPLTQQDFMSYPSIAGRFTLGDG